MTPLSFPHFEAPKQDLQFNQKPEEEDAQLVQMEDMFNQMLSDMGTMFEKSLVFFKKMQKEFDQSFQAYFMSDPDLTEPYFLPALPEESVKSTGVSSKEEGVSDFFQLIFDLSKTVLEGVAEVVTEAFEGYTENVREIADQIKGKFQAI